MHKKIRFFLITILLLISLALTLAALSERNKEEKAGAVFVKEIDYAEDRI